MTECCCRVLIHNAGANFSMDSSDGQTPTTSYNSEHHVVGTTFKMSDSEHEINKDVSDILNQYDSMLAQWPKRLKVK